MNLTNAQQARRVLDRLVGFNLSPVLWRKVKPSLSAGRVQSVAVRLIVEREREIQAFKSEPYFRINAIFAIKDAAGNTSEIRAELDKRFTTHEDAVAFLEKCRKAKFTIDSISKKPLKRTPAPPFTTSTLQQEAARKLGFTVSQTMMVAQHLYENGHITYMRTDSVNLSQLCIGTSKEAVIKMYGEEYSKPRNYSTHTKGAQEAHEAIRPTYMENTSIEGTLQERRLYELIWKRTAATQMADAQIEKTTVNISVSDTDEQFIATGEVVVFDGFLKVYRESDGDDDNDKNNEEAGSMPASMKEGDTIERVQITSLERASMGPIRYTEASLVHKLEELGIGRPSTYAPTISTIQQREYVQKGDKKGEEREYTIDTLKGNSIKASKKTEMVGSEKGKLLPTDIGIVVNDFLMEYFPGIMDYNFTANVEEKFDSIAEGKENWSKMLKDFYKDFAPEVEKTINSRSEHKAGERVLGEDPKSHKPVSVKIGRFGPVVQIGSAEDEEKPRFAQLPKDKSLETITLEEALELFRLPRTLDEFEGETITIGAGRFGPYVQHNRKYVSIPKDMDPLTITREQAIELIEKSRDQEKQRHVKTFEEDAELEVMNGRYGPYICYKGKNYRMPKNMHERAAELTYEQCMEIVNTPVKAKK
jgi:DNA topoisomerase-1